MTMVIPIEKMVTKDSRFEMQWLNCKFLEQFIQRVFFLKKKLENEIIILIKKLWFILPMYGKSVFKCEPGVGKY